MKLFSALLFSSALTLAACGSQTTPAEPKTDNARHPLGVNIASTPSKSKGMVAAANPLATQAGVDVLRAGGSAIDAAIAVQAMLGLVEPQSSGIGGGAFMIVYDPKTSKVWDYNGRERAPQSATDTLFTDPETGQPIRYFEGIASGKSTGVPGAIVMLSKAHDDYGKLPWAQPYEAAIKTAEDGFAVSPRLAGITKRMGSRLALKEQPASRDYFFPEDGQTPLQIGYIRDNKPYAESLRAIQKNPRALLEGELAQKIIEAVREQPRPGELTLADMAAYQPKKTEALCSSYRAHTVCGARPPSSGGVAVQSILRTLENFDMAALGQSADGWHVFAEASFLSYADRNHFVADPDYVPFDVTKMLAKDYLKSRAGLISMDRAISNVKAGEPFDFKAGQDATPDSPGTSHFTIVDADGLTVSMTTTVEAPFGSQRMAGGFMLNNQLTDFSFRSRDKDGNPIANSVAGGKQPRSSMSPSIVFAPNGEFLFTTGSPGGNSIIAYTAKTIIGILDWGLSPQEAIELPNVIARRGSLKMEAKGIVNETTQEIDRGSPAEEFGMPANIVKALEAKGHKVVRSRGEYSGVQIIYRNEDGSLTGAADPRREGTAQGL